MHCRSTSCLLRRSMAAATVHTQKAPSDVAIGIHHADPGVAMPLPTMIPSTPYAPNETNPDAWR
jgi:hypothetical protein